MTDPFKERAELDHALADCGEDIEIRRLIGTSVSAAVECRAFVRRDRINDELVGGIVQRNIEIILSPSQIIAQGWPGPNSSATPTELDRRVPVKGDKAVWAGRVMNIEESCPIYIDNELVRIELRVKG